MTTNEVSMTVLSMQLQNAVALRNAQDQVLWTIAGFFGATNSVLLVGLFQSGGFPLSPWVPVTLIAAAALICAVWSSIQDRALGHIERHERLMIDLEHALGIETHLALSARINTKLYDETVGAGTAARVWMRKMGTAALWFWFSVAFLCVLHYRGVLKSAV